MKSIRLILLLLLFSDICFSQDISDLTIYWNKNYKLKCSDFRGEHRDTSKYVVAISMIEIGSKGFWSNNLPNYKVFVIFHRSTSWNTDTTCSILTHEQLHFDMAELYARKLRRCIVELRQNHDSEIQDYSNIMANIYKEWAQAINKYDQETFHGESKSKQEEWNEKIARDMEELKDYEVDYLEYLDNGIKDYSAKCKIVP